MKRVCKAFVGVFVAGVLVTACDGSAASGACSTIEDVGVKITALTDDLSKAQRAAKIDALEAGWIAGRIMAAGSNFGVHSKHRDYCVALDQIRKDSGL